MTKCYDLCDLLPDSLSLTIKDGNVLAIYYDDGPSGLCGQSMSITCPYMSIHLFDTEEEFKTYTKKYSLNRTGKHAQIRHVVVGEYSCPGKISIIKHHEDGKNDIAN